MPVNSPSTDSPLSDAVERFRAVLEEATTLRWLARLRERAATAASASALAGTVAWVGRATRASWLYRWLTREPDPEVVVIDLRDTWTVGPVLAALDRLLAPLARYARTAASRDLLAALTGSVRDQPVRTASVVVLAAVVANLAALSAVGSPAGSTVGVRLVLASLAIAGTRVTVSADELADTRVAAALMAVLEPPEPPEASEQPDQASAKSLDSSADQSGTSEDGS